ncbi:hypothetical protein ACLH0M_21095, partial [Aeromonas media]
LLLDNDFSFFERRYFSFFRLFDTKQKYLMCVFYPEQFMRFFISKTIMILFKSFRGMVNKVKRYE